MPRQVKRQRALLQLLPLLLLAMSLRVQAQDYGQSAANINDPFGLYDNIEFVGAGVGPLFFTGDLDAQYETAAAANLRLCMQLKGPLCLMSSLLGGVSKEQGSDTGVLFAAASVQLHARLASASSWLQPYFEGGFGLLALQGGQLELIAGAGLDWMVWESGGLGVHASYHYLPAEAGAMIPVLLHFSRTF